MGNVKSITSSLVSIIALAASTILSFLTWWEIKGISDVDRRTKWYQWGIMGVSLAAIVVLTIIMII